MDNAYMEMRSIETSKKLNWMLTYSKDPELVDLINDIIMLDPESSKVVKRILRATVESIHLYTLSSSYQSPTPTSTFDKEMEDFLSPKCNSPKVVGSFSF